MGVRGAIQGQKYPKKWGEMGEKHNPPGIEIDLINFFFV